MHYRSYPNGHFLEFASAKWIYTRRIGSAESAPPVLQNLVDGHHSHSSEQWGAKLLLHAVRLSTEVFCFSTVRNFKDVSKHSSTISHTQPGELSWKYFDKIHQESNLWPLAYSIPTSLLIISTVTADKHVISNGLEMIMWLRRQKTYIKGWETNCEARPTSENGFKMYKKKVKEITSVVKSSAWCCMGKESVLSHHCYIISVNACGMTPQGGWGPFLCHIRPKYRWASPAWGKKEICFSCLSRITQPQSIAPSL